MKRKPGTFAGSASGSVAGSASGSGAGSVFGSGFSLNMKHWQQGASASRNRSTSTSEVKFGTYMWGATGEQVRSPTHKNVSYF